MRRPDAECVRCLTAGSDPTALENRCASTRQPRERHNEMARMSWCGWAPRTTGASRWKRVDNPAAATRAWTRRCDTDEPGTRTPWHTPDRITLDRRPAPVARCGRGMARAHSRRATAEQREKRPGRRDSPRRRRRRVFATARPASRYRVPARSGLRQAMGVRAATSRSDIELRDPAARGQCPYAPNYD